MLYEYPGFRNGCSKCALAIRRRGQTTLVICTELEDTPGTSVTNFADHLATRVCQADETIAPPDLDRELLRTAGRALVRAVPRIVEPSHVLPPPRTDGSGAQWWHLSADVMAALRRAIEG